MTDVVRRAGIASAVGALAVAAVVAAATGSGGAADDRDAGAAAVDRWIPRTPSPLERTEVAAARIGRHVYVVGGFEAQSGETTGAVARYNVKHDRWKRVEPLPIGVNHATAAAHDRKLYVHGGFTASGGLAGATSRLYSYNPRRDRWRRLRDSGVPRAAHALAAIGDRLYAAGGANSSSQELSSLEVYDISDGEWTDGPSMSVGRNHVAATVAGGRFYVLGGRPLNTAVGEAFDPRSRSWSSIAPMGTPRSGFAAAPIRGRVAVFGGEELGPGGTTIEEVELYDPATDRWTELPVMRTPRHGVGGVSRKRRLFALEGGPRPGFAFSDAVEYLDVPKALVR
ncbi:MAG TPA: kelch repeat-containing protein [Solirubrobacterales bacterium]|nr:kelch repeat-containing protein [Solirubrobacterales bacterium]